MGISHFATQDIKEGDLLFSVPLQWVMHVTAARGHPQLSGPLAAASLPPGMRTETQVSRRCREHPAEAYARTRDAARMQIIAMLLLYEDCQRGEPDSTCKLSANTSEWRPYLDVLPRNFTAPIFWSPAELALLKGSQATPPLPPLASPSPSSCTTAADASLRPLRPPRRLPRAVPVRRAGGEQIEGMAREDEENTAREWDHLRASVVGYHRDLFCERCFNLDTCPPAPPRPLAPAPPRPRAPALDACPPEHLRRACGAGAGISGRRGWCTQGRSRSAASST